MHIGTLIFKTNQLLACRSQDLRVADQKNAAKIDAVREKACLFVKLANM